MNEDDKVRGFFQFSEDEILRTPYTKFELQYPKTGDADDLVHIRCCYNNKYLVRSSAEDDWIVGAADEPEEDKSKWSCTLFQLLSSHHTTNGYTLRHVQTGFFVQTESFQSHPHCLSILPVGDIDIQLVDMDTLVTLPMYIAFKGDNGKYLRAHMVNNHEYNQFAADDIGGKVARYQVFPLYDGRVRIKSLQYDKFWRRSPNWIWSDSRDSTNNNKDTLFMPVKVASKVIALRNLGNNLFCKRLTTEGNTNCLNAGTSEITREAQLEVVDTVLRREIYNVTFQIEDGRRYNMTTVDSITKDVTNKNSTETVGDVSFSYTETRSNTWNKSNSWSLGVSVDMTTDIPFIGETGITIEGSYSGEYSWGESLETSKELSTSETVTTPPMTRSIVTMLVQRGTIDIPFTYDQRDTLYDGTTEITRQVDGIFTGVNTFVKFDISYESLLEEEI
ncbi:uncharacterized protein LOC105637044 [Jatropha curcas]|nr:uncharacterized protein LOC105637044 [Jatropha curcas]